MSQQMSETKRGRPPRVLLPQAPEPTGAGGIVVPTPQQVLGAAAFTLLFMATRGQQEALIEALLIRLDAQDGDPDAEPDADDEPETDDGGDDDGPVGAHAARVADALAYFSQVNGQPLTTEQAARAFKWVQ